MGVEMLEGNPEEVLARIEAKIAAAETALGHRFEARLHEIAKGLHQPFEITAAFVTRVFSTMPAHVRPGNVAPYNVDELGQPVTRELLYAEDVNPATGQVDANPERIVGHTKDAGGVPDITR